YNAPNQFTEIGSTEPHREQTAALLDSLFHQYVGAIAESRGKSAQQVRALIDEGPYDGVSALKAGLVDELVYRDELEKRIKAPEQLTPGRYVRSARGFGFDGRPRVALIYAVGEIVSGDRQSGPFSGQLVGPDSPARSIRAARNDGPAGGVGRRVGRLCGAGSAG